MSVLTGRPAGVVQLGIAAGGRSVGGGRVADGRRTPPRRGGARSVGLVESTTPPCGPELIMRR